MKVLNCATNKAKVQRKSDNLTSFWRNISSNGEVWVGR